MFNWMGPRPSAGTSVWGSLGVISGMASSEKAALVTGNVLRSAGGIYSMYLKSLARTMPLICKNECPENTEQLVCFIRFVMQKRLMSLVWFGA